MKEDKNYTHPTPKVDDSDPTRRGFEKHRWQYLSLEDKKNFDLTLPKPQDFDRLRKTIFKDDPPSGSSDMDDFFNLGWEVTSSELEGVWQVSSIPFIEESLIKVVLSQGEVKRVYDLISLGVLPNTEGFHNGVLTKVKRPKMKISKSKSGG